MSWKIIAIFTTLLFTLGVLSGIPFGMWASNEDQVIYSNWFHYLQDVINFLISTCVFYLLFKQKINKPILHAFIIASVSSVASIILLYFLIGIVYPALLLAFNAALTVVSILIAFSLARSAIGRRHNA